MEDFYNRQIKWQQDVQKEARKEAKKLQKQKVDDCSFRPTTNDKVNASLKPRIAEDSSMMSHVKRQEKGRQQKQNFQERTEFRKYMQQPPSSLPPQLTSKTTNGPHQHEPSPQVQSQNEKDVHEQGNPFDVNGLQENRDSSSSQRSATLNELADMDHSGVAIPPPPGRASSADTYEPELNGDHFQGHKRTSSAPIARSFNNHVQDTNQAVLLQQLVDYLDGDQGADSGLDEEESFFVQLQRERREWQRERAQLLSVIQLQQKELEKRAAAVQDKAEEISSAFGNAVNGFEQRLYAVEQEVQFLRGRTGSSPRLTGQNVKHLQDNAESSQITGSSRQIEVLGSQIDSLQQKMDIIISRLPNV
mmetsp:Transcript_31132/g.41182  ORF Transcript_31132/g.41182 Transcript_31132/m.41182 type:complete len:361 (-) Transcript_31132:324-1406(-)